MLLFPSEKQLGGEKGREGELSMAHSPLSPLSFRGTKVSQLLSAGFLSSFLLLLF